MFLIKMRSLHTVSLFLIFSQSPHVHRVDGLVFSAAAAAADDDDNIQPFKFQAR
jgi:hypothetical protein